MSMKKSQLKTRKTYNGEPCLGHFLTIQPDARTSPVELLFLFESIRAIEDVHSCTCLLPVDRGQNIHS